MGIFDTLTAPGKCPFCGHQQRWRIQFKYGDCRQTEKKLGDTIKWSEKKLRFYDYGDDVGGRVKTGGFAENRCESCKGSTVHAVIFIQDNVIDEVELSKDPVDFGAAGFRKVH